jgi:hypothetical protein
MSQDRRCDTQLAGSLRLSQSSVGEPQPKHNAGSYRQRMSDREAPGLAGRSRMERCHSALSAITGSTRVARRAGKNEAHSASSINATDSAR